MEDAVLAIVADDYGYAGAYDAGILAAAEAGAIDAASAMVLRGPDPGPLLASGVEIGLHLEPAGAAPLERQLADFERLFGRLPDYLDGHRHCHAEAGGVALAVAELACRLAILVRSVSARHRRLLRGHGVATADLLVGRMGEGEAALPAELATWIEGGEPPRPPTIASPSPATPPRTTVIEWMTHPGRSAEPPTSAYDRGREEDLELLLALGDRGTWRRRGILRLGPAAALAR